MPVSFRRIVLGMAVTAIPLAGPAALEARQVLTMTLSEGQRVTVTGTDLVIDVVEVRNLTAEGCLGGPAGCPDHVRLEVTRASRHEEITLYLAATERQREDGVGRADLFGYRITLDAVHGKRVSVSVTTSR